MIHKIKACILIIEGTNCEEELKTAFESVGVNAELVHLKQLIGECKKELRRNLLDYQILALPGGWSAGDYIRAGAIFSARIKSKLMPEIEEFLSENLPIIGICNGFQILVELGILPGFDDGGISQEPIAALIQNSSGKFQCRATYLKHENKCKLTEKIPEKKVLQVPVAHAEGRLTFGKNNEKFLEKLIENKQIIFRYCKVDGKEAKGEFPWNPNGSLFDIAGISNPQGNILGLMPHPERVTQKIQMADWTRRKEKEERGDGKIFFESVVEYVKKYCM